jgi:class 3 adenylate cyclase
MPFLFGVLYRKLGRAYFALYPLFEFVSAFLVCLGTVGIFALYTETSAGEFWRVVAVAEAATMAAISWSWVRAWKIAKPVVAWMKRGRTQEDAIEAWRCAAAIPRRLVLGNGWRPFAVIGLPVSVYATLEFGLPWWSGLIVFAGAVLAVAYAAILHFLASELFMRPVLEDISRRLPLHLSGAPLGVPLRWKLLGILPVINIVTGVVVSGLSTDGSASLADLGLDVVVAVVVAFTISLELTLLLTKSILGPVDDLLEATQAVKLGDLDARVPVSSGDELGQLAASFNEMTQGLSERQRLHAAFGSYVDPEVAQRVIDEGELLEGEEREVTVMFIDMRDFTPRAATSSARETVALLNEFFDVIVPLVRHHDGHANKFLGDGVLAVFGAPERLSDHAGRAVTAAREIVRAVHERFAGEIGVGIGLSSGTVVVGSVGGGGRLEFAVIGEPVNVAARVESMTRETGDVVLLTEATRRLLGDAWTGVEARGEAELRGISEPVSLYALVTSLDDRPTRPHTTLITDA